MKQNDRIIGDIENWIEHGVDPVSQSIDITDDDGFSDEETQKIIRKLAILDTEEPLHIILKSNGGDVDNALSIYDILKRWKAAVEIRAYGTCNSVAAVLMQAATVRKMSKNCYMMIHLGVEETEAAESKHPIDRKRESDFFDTVNDKLVDIFHEKMGKDNYHRDEVVELLTFDTYLSANKAKELGLIDEVIA